MNLQHLLYFKTAADCLSFSKAAKILYVSQPNITYAIRTVEEEIHSELFYRLGRSIKLTPAGTVYLSYVNQIFDLLEQGAKDAAIAADTTGGNVALAYMSSLNEYVPYLTNMFLHDRPDYLVRFSMSQFPTSQIEDAVLSGECDLGIASKSNNPKLERFTLGSHETFLIAPKDSELGKRGVATLKDLDGQPFITYDKSCRIRGMIDDIFMRADVRPLIEYEAVFDNLIMGMVSSGLGYAFIPRPTGNYPKNVCVVKLEEDLPVRTIQLVWAKGRKLTPAADLFKAYILESNDLLDFNSFAEMMER